MQRTLFLIQRLTALLLAPLVIIHLILIFYAVNGGLSAEEILGRTRGNYGWGLFYTLFVIAAALHAPIGIRNVLIEWTPLPRQAVTVLCIFLSIGFLWMGMTAVRAVV